MSAAAHPSQRSPAGLRRRPSAPVDRSIAIGRRTLAGAGVGLFLVAAWASGATWYLFSRDEIASRFLAKQTEMQYAYEDRIAALRAHLDRVASQRLLEQDGIEGRVSDLIVRQVQLETRQAVLTTLAERAGVPAAFGLLRGPEPKATATPSGVLSPPTKPALLPEPSGLRLRNTEPDIEPARGRPQRTTERDSPDGSARERLARIDQSINRVEAAQMRALDSFAQTAQARVARIRTAVIEAGLDPDRLRADAARPMGGPLTPLPATTKQSDPFETLAERASASLAQLERLRRSTAALPFGRPMAGDPDLTSGFGARIDPFTRGPALHTGLDFRTHHGAPARAAGPGKVIAAEYSGGYGNMVEIDHGHGVTTRYAHLSAFAVGVGQTVAAGAVVGYVGSTGRSTGAHLHYETRIDDEPVDPQRFLRAGLKLAGTVESVPR